MKAIPDPKLSQNRLNTSMPCWNWGSVVKQRNFARRRIFLSTDVSTRMREAKSRRDMDTAGVRVEIISLCIQSFAKDWRILIVLKTWKMRQSLACQSLACQFLTAFFRNFLVQKLTFVNFGDILKRFLTKLGNETILKIEIDGHMCPWFAGVMSVYAIFETVISDLP